MRVRKFGDTTSYEEAPGALGITSIVRRVDGEYQSGGFLATTMIPVDTDGKFEYQLQNDSAAPRNIIRILEVTTIEEIEDSIPLIQKGAANGVASLNGSALVVENPANATATPGIGKIPVADGAGKLDAWVSIPSVPPMFEIIGAITVAASHTGDTNETELGKITVPGNSMGPNGSLRIWSTWQTLLSGGNKNMKVKWGGQILESQVWAGTGCGSFTPLHIWNTGATNSQKSQDWAMAVGHLKAGGTVEVAAKDTTADVDITFTGQLGNAGDTVALEFALVERYYSN